MPAARRSISWTRQIPDALLLEIFTKEGIGTGVDYFKIKGQVHNEYVKT